MKVYKNKLIMVTEKEFNWEKIRSSENVSEFLYEVVEIDKEPEEVLVLLCLDNAKNIVSYCDVSRGTINKSIVHPREIFKRAILSNASAIIVSHNHPSGKVEPSIEDKLITEKIALSGQLLGIELLDHIIIGKNGDYYSFLDNFEESLMESNKNLSYKFVKKKLLDEDKKKGDFDNEK